MSMLEKISEATGAEKTSCPHEHPPRSAPTALAALVLAETKKGYVAEAQFLKNLHVKILNKDLYDFRQEDGDSNCHHPKCHHPKPSIDRADFERLQTASTPSALFRMIVMQERFSNRLSELEQLAKQEAQIPCTEYEKRLSPPHYSPRFQFEQSTLRITIGLPRRYQKLNKSLDAVAEGFKSLTDQDWKRVEKLCQEQNVAFSPAFMQRVEKVKQKALAA
jgi:hypothetical protein